MDRLNYHHLLYFWVVVREGSVTRAARRLHLAQPTVSGQIRALEDTLGERLFDRGQRSLRLNEVGRAVFAHADEIFARGEDLADAVRQGTLGRGRRLRVGLVDSFPKRLAHRLLAPVLEAETQTRVEVREDSHEALLAALAIHDFDVVLSDRPAGVGTTRRMFDHALGDTPIQWYAAASIAPRFRRRFPASLQGAPVLLPRHDAALRRQLDDWFDREGIRPHIVAELDDSALAKVMAEECIGLVPAPTVLEADLRRRQGLAAVGPAEGVVERYQAITVERRLEHPAIALLTRAAREQIFRSAATRRTRARRKP